MYAGHKAKRLELQCISGASSNPVEGRTNMCQLKDLILTLLGLIFRRIYIYIFGKQTGYICTFSVSLIWASKNNNNVVDKNRNIYASLNQYHNTE